MTKYSSKPVVKAWLVDCFHVSELWFVDPWIQWNQPSSSSSTTLLLSPSCVCWFVWRWRM